MARLKTPQYGQRPWDFGIDCQNPLWDGLLFANLGQTPSTTLYRDESPAKVNGILNGYTSSGNYPLNQWQYSNFLQRWALAFNGTGDYVNGVTGIGMPNTVTVAAWVYVPSSPNASPGGVAGNIMNWQDRIAFNNTDRTFGFINSPNRFLAQVYVSSNTIAYSPTISPLGAWHHGAWTLSGSYLTCYCDGIAGTPVSHTTGAYQGFAAPNIQVGASHYGGSTYYWNGSVSDCMAWNRCLSPQEIALLASPSRSIMLDGALVTPLGRSWMGYSGATASGSNSVPEWYYQQLLGAA